jgi:serine/threonine-protein kinase
MPLAGGTRLGTYDILAALGAGGMGEVYRAKDTKLGREVALKILPATFTNDPERLARFRREAQVLAALNHPHIGAIYGLEEANGTQFLVLELVDGESLDKRIARGRIPVDEALGIAKQIAEALESAHEKGIIHRDLKPANVALTNDGTVKVLDFGLAKAVEATAANDLSMSPTITSPAGMTGVGVILGTAAYMAPEQARGRAVDKRTDIWAFGAVLFEMLTGKRAFEDEDVSMTLSKVLQREPDFGALPHTIPARVKQTLRLCLQKDPKQRIGDVRDVRLALEGAFETMAPHATAAAAFAAPRSVLVRVLPWAIASVAVIAAVALWAPWRPAPVSTPRRLLAGIGADGSVPNDAGASVVLSPDGSTLAFVATQAGQARLFIRKLDELQGAPLAGTEGAASPFFSPDGQWIAFFAGGKLKKIKVTGGATVNLCDAPNGRGGTWIDDDAIIFTPTNVANVTLMRVSAAGGAPVAFGALSEGAVTQRWAQALPDGKGVLFSEHVSTTNWDGANLVVAPLSGGAPKVVVRGGYYGRYVPSGHLIYMQQEALFAVRFDLSRLETIGQAVPALDVAANPALTGGAQFAFSRDGTLVYLPGGNTSSAKPIDWVTRDGKTSVLRATKADWANPRFSPDGQKLAVDISDGRQRDIWVYDWARDTPTQLTFDSGNDRNPVWTPDGRRIVFASDRAKKGTYNLYWVNADGTGEVSRLTDSPDTQLPWSWHPSGKFLAFSALRGLTGADLMILPMEGDAARGWTPGKATAFLATPATETSPMFSPDGRWIAYFSNAAGSNYDIYVRPFPSRSGEWRISTERGLYPRWSTITSELLFLTLQGKVMSAPYAVVGDSFRADTPQIWSPVAVQGAGIGNSAYDLHPDGKRLAAATAPVPDPSAVQDRVVFVSNFFDYLRKIAPTK